MKPTSTPLYDRRRYSSCIEEPTKYSLSLDITYELANTSTMEQSEPRTTTLHESKSLEIQEQGNGEQDASIRKDTNPLLLPSMVMPVHHTWHSCSNHEQQQQQQQYHHRRRQHHHQSKDIVSAIMAVVNNPESESLGWVGVGEHDSGVGHASNLPYRPPSPPLPPPPIENDTHIFDLLTTDNSYFVHHSQRPDHSSSMSSATVEKLVEILTNGMDSDLEMNFFLTFRQFLTPIKLCKLLILRFRWALLDDTDDRRLVRIRTFVVLRYWLTHYWDHDFATSRTLRFMLCTFLSQLRTHPAILASPRDARIIKSLRNLLKRQRKLFCNKLESSTRDNICTKNAVSQQQQQDDHAALSFTPGSSPWSRRCRIDSTATSSSYSSSSFYPSQTMKSGNSSIKNLNYQKLPSKARKDSGFGTNHNQKQQQQHSGKGLRSSISTPTLPFLGRTRRLSTCSQRSVHEENAWTGKMNFGIKTIKRTVPSVYHSLMQSIVTSSRTAKDIHHQQQQQQNRRSFCSTNKSSSNKNNNNNKCTCQHQQNSHHHRYSKSVIMRSASRLFEQKSSAPSALIPISASISTYDHHQFDILPSSHTDPACPHYSSRKMTTTPISLASSLSSSPTKNMQTYRTTQSHQQQQQLHRASYYSDESTTTTNASHLSTNSHHISSTLPLDTSRYKPFILAHRSEVIAQQFCMIEQDMLQMVTWDELAELRWRKRSKGTVISPDIEQSLLQDGVEQLIGFFNKTCQWVASEIVQAKSMDIRIRVIEKFIRIALKCYHHRNYSTLMQILLGLQAPAVSRLEKTWQRIDHYEKQIFNELKELAKPFRNWKNVRDAMSKATEDIAESSAVESVLTKETASEASIKSMRGCIPFLGLYLSDLVFNAELPTFIDSQKLQHRQLPVDINAEDQELCRRLGSHLVNYNKFRITASIIKHILAFQVLSRSYHFLPHEDVILGLQNMRLLDSTEIRTQSGLCEPDSY
ncbi:ras guanine nucleotide exchange factor domain-containing protein [Absidia repens]|uniref:Ras guanine nucleotide exchange factor domain-containing protein n=1 Tax=Absidia repens TaxID=90262 RepID=A0A1X2HZ95_9FUNG|nr:ras guanine nucleotide exchange factor domain-containing protein [Absidia repens]